MRKITILYLSLLLISCDNYIGPKVSFLTAELINIKQILSAAVNYSDKEVFVKGISSEVIKTPLGSMYLLTDETGSIWVKTTQLPTRESVVLLKANVENIFLFRDYSFGLHLVEIEKGN